MDKKKLLISMMLICSLSFGCEGTKVTKQSGQISNLLTKIQSHIPTSSNFFTPTDDETINIPDHAAGINNIARDLRRALAERERVQRQDSEESGTTEYTNEYDGWPDDEFDSDSDDETRSEAGSDDEKPYPQQNSQIEYERQDSVKTDSVKTDSVKINDEEKNQNVYGKIKKKLLSYLTSDIGKDNQFTSEFEKVFFRTDFDEISDEKLRNILERVSTGFDKAEVLISKGINLGRTIGSILLPIIEIFSTGTIDPQSIMILRNEGPLHKFAKILEKAQVGRHIISTVANSTNKTIKAVKEVMNSSDSPVKKGIKIVSNLFSKAKNVMKNTKVVSSFFNSTIGKKQTIINKIVGLISEHEKTMETDEKESQRHSSSQSSNLIDEEAIESSNRSKKDKRDFRTFSQFASCGSEFKFQYFCSNKK